MDEKKKMMAMVLSLKESENIEKAAALEHLRKSTYAKRVLLKQVDKDLAANQERSQ